MQTLLNDWLFIFVCFLRLFLNSDVNKMLKFFITVTAPVHAMTLETCFKNTTRVLNIVRFSRCSVVLSTSVLVSIKSRVHLVVVSPHTPGTSCGIFPHKPGTSCGISPHKPGTSCGISPHKPGTSCGSFPHKPGTSCGSFPHEPGTSCGSFPHKPGTSCGSFLRKPGTSCGSFPHSNCWTSVLSWV